MDKRLPKLSDMQAARERQESTGHMRDALLALAKRAGRLVIPIGALRDLREGDSMAIEVVPDEGLVITYVAPGGAFTPVQQPEEPSAG